MNDTKRIALQSVLAEYFADRFAEEAEADGSIPNSSQLDLPQIFYISKVMTDFLYELMRHIPQKPFGDISVSFHQENHRLGQMEVDNKVVAEFSIPIINVETGASVFSVKPLSLDK